MISSLRASGAAFTASILVFAAACGGTSVSHDDTGGMAGKSESGGSGTTGGSSGHGGAGAVGGADGGSGGITTGGSTSTGGSISDGGSVATGGTGGTGAMGGTGALGGAGGTAGSSGRGGTGGISGSAGDAGGGGTGGTTPCVSGGMCTTEGASCSESTCCSCSHTCKGGVWSAGICPPCAAPLCPQSPPTDGDMCAACSIPPEGCAWDERPVDGPLYQAQCVNSRWVVTTEGGGGCCSTDSDCSGRGICLSSQCRATTPDHCWRDDQCGTDEVCAGAHFCACGVTCGAPDEPGVCVRREAQCCLADTDCFAPSYCVKGVCKAPPSAGCWTARDCIGGGLCQSANVCTCGESCFAADSPGACVFPL